MSVLELIKEHSNIDVQYNDFKDQINNLIDSTITDESVKKHNPISKGVLASFILVLVAVAIIVAALIPNIKDNKINQINNAIDNLEKIGNDEEKIKEIILIDKSIKNLSQEKQANIHLDKLAFETSSTTLKLKNSVSWTSCLNFENNYYLLYNIFDIKTISELKLSRAEFASIDTSLTDVAKITTIINLLDLPYIDIIEGNADFQNIYKEKLWDDYSDYCTLTINDTKQTNISVFGGGYVLLNNNEGTSYISLISVDYSIFRNICGAFGDDDSFLLSSKIEANNIDSIIIIESINDYLLGINPTWLAEEDNITNFYNNYLENLCFYKDDDAAQRILSGLTNDYKSIQINFEDTYCAHILIDSTSKKYVLIRGAMEYVGTGVWE